MKDPKRINHLLNSVLIKYGYKNQLLEIEIKQIFNDIVGRMIVKHTQKMSLKNNVLTINLDSPIVKNELLYIKDSLVKQINDRIGQDVISKIVIY